MRPEYMPITSGQKLGYLIEECGEVLAAAGKTLRWGPDGYNPELPSTERETNRAWLTRELQDLRRAIEYVESVVDFMPAVLVERPATPSAPDSAPTAELGASEAPATPSGAATAGEAREENTAMRSPAITPEERQRWGCNTDWPVEEYMRTLRLLAALDAADALADKNRALLEALDAFLNRLITSETLPSGHESAGHQSIVAVDALDALRDVRAAITNMRPTLAAYRAMVAPASAERSGAATAKHQTIFGECECETCAPEGPPAAGSREARLRAALEEIAVHQGDPSLEAEQMRSAARAALAPAPEPRPQEGPTPA